MNLFQFSESELLLFFIVLIRYSTLFAILPFFGDRIIPVPVKILLSLSLSIALFPGLLKSGSIQISQVALWSSTSTSLIGVIFSEVLFALFLGFIARFAFEAITFGGNLVGNFMGLASASTFDPHQESQSQIIAQVQSTLAMLIFLAVDAHHTMLRASLESFKIVGVGAWKSFSPAFAESLIDMSGNLLIFGIQLAAPVAIAMFAVNVAFGVMARAMPQLNILVLSFAVSTLVGLSLLLLGLGEFSNTSQELFANGFEWMDRSMKLIRQGS